MSQVSAARAQFGVSLAFHIIFAAIGVGLPALLFVAEGIGLFKRDQEWYALARRWSIAFAILYAIGNVSGTIIEYELGLLWPSFMRYSGGIVGVAFLMEAVAFMIEGIFIGLYLFGWKRLSPIAHWLLTVPLIVGGIASAELIVAANAWMQTPTGYRMQNGNLIFVDPLGAMNNPFAPVESFHMSLGSYEATAFGVAAIYGWAILRGRRTGYERKGFFLGMVIGTLIAPLQIWVGDINAELVASYQPIKLAAMELVFHTQSHAPELLGGWPNGQSVSFGLFIPNFLSWLAFHDVSHPVQGLDSVPRFFWPPYQYVHLEWQIMLLAGGAGAGLAAFFWFFYGLNIYRNIRRGAKHITENALPIDGFIGKLMLLGGVGVGFLTFAAIWMGWGVTEMGRQPWVVYGRFLTADAVQPAPWLNISFIVFCGVYVVLGLTLIFSLLYLARRTIELRTTREMVTVGGDDE